MLKLLLAVFTFFLFSTTSAQADSNLQISSSSDFSNTTDVFVAGQTIHVKVKANSKGENKHELNLRDNNFKLLSSYNLDYSGDYTFKGAFGAPQNNGTYSVEAKIESQGSVSNSVKTIKVGNSSSSNVKVDVNVHSTGQSTTVKSQTSQSQNSKPTLSPLPSPSSPSPSPELPTPQPEVQGTKDTNFIIKIWSFFENLFSVLTRK